MGSTYVSDSNILLTGLLQPLGKETLLLELEVHLRLIRLDLDEDVTRVERIAGILVPRSNTTGGHSRRKRGHKNDGVRREGCSR